MQEFELGVNVAVVQDNRPADHIGVAADVFGGAVDDKIGPEAQGVLQNGGGEGVVYAEPNAPCAGELGHGRNIGQAQHGVGGGFEPHQTGVGLQGGLDGGRVGRIGKGELNPVMAENFVEQTEGAAVHVVAAQHMFAGLDQPQKRVYGGHARGEGEGVSAAFERGEGGLQGGAGGVVGAGILVPLMHGHIGLGIGGGLVDGGHHGPGGGVWLHPRMDGQCLWPEVGSMGHGNSCGDWFVVAALAVHADWLTR